MPLFEQRKLAVRVQRRHAGRAADQGRVHRRARKRPRNLFSHSDQQLAAQGQIPGQLTPSGWGGRSIDVDRRRQCRGAASRAWCRSPGDALFTQGVTSLPVALSRFGSLGPGAAIRIRPTGKIRYEALARILAADRDNQLVAQAQEVMALAVRSSEALAGALSDAERRSSTRRSPA